MFNFPQNFVILKFLLYSLAGTISIISNYFRLRFNPNNAGLSEAIGERFFFWGKDQFDPPSYFKKN